MNTTYKHLAVIAALALVAPAMTLTSSAAFAKHGADDPAGDDRGGKGKDDGPNHAERAVDPTLLLARQGRGGHDDGPSHG